MKIYEKFYGAEGMDPTQVMTKMLTRTIPGDICLQGEIQNGLRYLGDFIDHTIDLTLGSNAPPVRLFGNTDDFRETEAALERILGTKLVEVKK